LYLPSSAFICGSCFSRTFPVFTCLTKSLVPVNFEM
jgi:hypothetical protein